MLTLHDTATGKVESIVPRETGRISMYVCGPTVYDVPHLGHGRFALVFDVLRRYIEFNGSKVCYVSNITDIDDKIIAKAQQESRTSGDVAEEFEKVWWFAMDRLGVARPTKIPHATGYVDQMVAAIGEMVSRGKAYEISDGVYFATSSVKDYGLLALQSPESLQVGARVESNAEKRSPLDFVLWKKAKPGEPSWPSPWGHGRPGWHTECVVMSLGLLGESFDIHGGGADLAFPHHENERAQSMALGKQFARHWVHNGWVTVGGEKMAKSLGNYTSLSDFLAKSDPRAYRLLVLRSHYRQPLEVTPRTVKDAEEALARLDALVRRCGSGLNVEVNHGFVTSADALQAGANPEAIGQFCSRMDNDLDTPGALAGIFELVRSANASADRGDGTEAQQVALTVRVLCAALGITFQDAVLVGPELDEEGSRLVRERDQARAGHDWARADAIRSELIKRGWVLEDGPDGTKVRKA
ncbi:MAG: cysteine--tRNA ligase [Acidimicrobiales bacterium]